MRNRSGAQAAQAVLFARCIAEEMTLGLNTCASSLIQRRGSDRTTKRHRQRLERIELGQRLAGWRRLRLTGDALPRQAQRVVKQGRSLDQGGERLGAVMFSQPSLVAHFVRSPGARQYSGGGQDCGALSMLGVPRALKE